jgi:hypothetical protein
VKAGLELRQTNTGSRTTPEAYEGSLICGTPWQLCLGQELPDFLQVGHKLCRQELPNGGNDNRSLLLCCLLLLGWLFCNTCTEPVSWVCGNVIRVRDYASCCMVAMALKGHCHLEIQ